MIKQQNLIDIRQTKEYASFMKKIGWRVDKDNITNTLLDTPEVSRGNTIYIKKLPFVPFSVIKILRCSWPLQLIKLKKLIKKYNPLFIKLQPFIFKNCKLKIGNWKFISDKSPLIPTKTIWIDLNKNETELLKNMKQKTRYNIRLAQKKGVKTKIISGNKITSKQLLAFYNIWKKNRPFNWLFRPNFNELKWLVQSFKEKCFFVFSYNLQLTTYNLIGGILILQSSNMAFYWHNCSTKRGKKLFAPTLSVWQAIKEAKKRGLKIFDFEGIYDKRFHKVQKGWQGFSKFKKGFGGKEIEFTRPLINYLPSYQDYPGLLPSRA